MGKRTFLVRCTPALMSHSRIRALNDCNTAVAVFAADLSHVEWANTAAAALFGLGSPGPQSGCDEPLSRAARQIHGSRRMLIATGAAKALIRRPGGAGVPLTAHLEWIALDGEQLVLVFVRDAGHDGTEAGAALERRLLAESGPGPRHVLAKGATIATEDPRLVQLVLDFLACGDDLREVEFEGRAAVLARVADGLVLLAMDEETVAARDASIEEAPTYPDSASQNPLPQRSNWDAASKEADAEGDHEDRDQTSPDDPSPKTGLDDEAERPMPEGTNISVSEAGARAQQEEFRPRFDGAPARFVWRVDADRRFRSVSPEFAAAIGARSADVVGYRFEAVAAAYGLDPAGEITRLLSRRDTWSGRTVLWPVEGSDKRAPVDLAALPVFAHDRSFDGFRGFAVVRLADAVDAPEVHGMTLGPTAFGNEETETEEATGPATPACFIDFEDDDLASEMDDGLVAAPAFGRRAPEDRPPDPAAKIIRLEERRRSRDLNKDEVAAFYAIGETLGDGARGTPLEQAVQRASQRISDMDQAGEPRGDEGNAMLTGGDPEEGDDGVGAGSGEAAGEQSEFSPGKDGTKSGAEGKAADADVSMPAVHSLPPYPDPETSQEEGAASSASAEAALPSSPVAGSEAGDLFEVPDRNNLSQPRAVQPLAPRTADPESISDPFVEALADAYRGLSLAILVQARDRLVFANREFFDLAGLGDLELIEARGGLSALLDTAEAKTPDDVPTGSMILTRGDGTRMPVTVTMQRARIAGQSCLVFSMLPAYIRSGAHTVEAASGRSYVIPEPGGPIEGVAASVGPSAAEKFVLSHEAALSALTTATDGLLVLNENGELVWLNPDAERLFGLAADAAAGRPFVSLFARESQKAVEAELKRGSPSDEVATCERDVIGLAADGRFLPLALRVARLPEEGGWFATMRDISRRKRAEEQLVQAQQEAETQSLQKSQFLTNISHEMRTPLNAILGFTDVMATECFGPIGDARYLEYLEDIRRSGHHLLELVNDLLDISKIEAGKLDLSFEAVPLNEVVGEIVQMMQPQANRARVIVRSNLPSSVPPVVADRRSVRQIALNLIGNAIRFTPEGGQLVVSTTYSPEGEVRLRFRDNGIGMNEDEIAIAMTPFRQVNARSAERGQGTGLGLPLTKAIAEANGARFSLTSTPGEGTLVEVTFPPQRVLLD